MDLMLAGRLFRTLGPAIHDYCKLGEISAFVDTIHGMKKEAWIAGSIRLDELQALWDTGVDVICVRSAACANDKGAGRFGKVSEAKVRELVATLPAGGQG